MLRSYFVLGALAAAAIAARLFLAWGPVGSLDAGSYDTVARIVRSGGNVYAETKFYNYSPVWFYLIGAMSFVAEAGGWRLIEVIRTFLTLVDVATGLLLWRLGGRWVAALFLLNPVSIWTTASHGQFDNLAVLFLLAALVAWPSAIVAVLVKQIVGPALIFLPFRRSWALAAAALVLFLISLVPWALTGGAAGIWTNVLTYASAPGVWGLTAVGIPAQLVMAVLVAFMICVAYLTRHLKPPERLVAWAVTFLVFTPGYGVQYLVLPIAVATLARSWWLIPYTLVAAPHIIWPELFSRAPIWVVLAVWWIALLVRAVFPNAQKRLSSDGFRRLVTVRKPVGEA